MVEAPKLPTKKCGFGQVPVAVFAYHRVLGFPVPISGVDVLFKTGPFETYIEKTNSVGLSQECVIFTNMFTVFVKKDGVNFGSGKSKWMNIGVFYGSTTPKLFRAKAKIECYEISHLPISIAPINFKFDATPNVTVPLVNISTPVGDLTIKPGILEDGGKYLPKFVVYLGGKKIAESNIEDLTGKIDLNLPTLKELSGKFSEIKDLFGKDVELKVEIRAGDCPYTGKKTISLPSIEIPKLCSGSLNVTTPTGLSIKDHIADYLSKIKTGTNPNAFPALFLQIESVVNGVKKDIAIELLLDGEKVTLTEPKSNRSQDLIRIIKTLGTKAFDTVHNIKINPLLDCAIDAVSFSIPALIPSLPELPKPPSACELWETAANISIPSLLKPPFKLKVSGANWICKDTGKKTLIDAIGEVSIGEREFSLPIKGGSGILTLTESDLMGEVPELPAPKLPAPETPKLPSVCEKTGKLGEPGKYFVTISEVQSYLDRCYPGQGHEAEQAPAGPWYGTFKITRGKATRYPAGSYFWANSWEGIRSTI